MWIEGPNVIKDVSLLNNTNHELLKIKDDLEIEEAQIALVKFLKANPSFALKILTGLTLRPYQDIMIRGMCCKDFFLGVCGRGVSKSTTAALFAPFYGIFNPGVKIGILSGSFRQSKNIIHQIEKFYNSPGGEFLKQCLTGQDHSPEAWVLKFGESEIYALPLGATADKIRGYRFNCLIIDEALLLTENIMNLVIKPFLSVTVDQDERLRVKRAEDYLIGCGKLKESERIKFLNNKLIILSSATFKFEYLYKIYRDYYDHIVGDAEKNKIVSHGIVQLSYEAFPEYFDENMVNDAKRTSTPAQFKREWCAQFTDESGSFYSLEKLNDVSIPEGQSPTVKLKGDPNKKYIIGLDPNYSDSETADDFAISVLELNDSDQSATLVHGYALPKSTIKKRASYLQYLFNNFNIVYFILDNAGGKKFLEDVKDVLPEFPRIFDYGGVDPFDYENVVQQKAIFSKEKGMMCHLQVFSKENWIRIANDNLQGLIHNKKIWFAAPIINDSDYHAAMSAKINIADLHFNNITYHSDVEKQNEFIDHQKYMVYLTKKEIAMIEQFSSPGGGARFDLPSNLTKDKTPSRARKDSYTSLLLASWGVTCYYALENTEIKKRAGFVPFFIA